MSVVEALMETARQDTELLIRNDEKGDDFSKPRVVDFLLLASGHDRAELVRDFINDHRYGDATVEEVDGEFRISVQIVMPITQHVLCSVSGFITCLAELYGLTYDGWGCVLQNT